MLFNTVGVNKDGINSSRIHYDYVWKIFSNDCSKNVIHYSGPLTEFDVIGLISVHAVGVTSSDVRTYGH